MIVGNDQEIRTLLLELDNLRRVFLRSDDTVSGFFMAQIMWRDTCGNKIELSMVPHPLPAVE